MFVFPRSAIAVVLPLLLLFAVVLWSNRDTRETARPAPVQAAAPGQPAAADQVLAANLPSR
jgi:hypothetical protein